MTTQMKTCCYISLFSPFGGPFWCRGPPTEEEVKITTAFWHHRPGGPCSIQFNFHKIPAGRNYICLCAVNTEYHNRLFMAEDSRRYRIKATKELNKHGLVGMILQFIPRTHRASPGENRLWTSRVPTLQFLAAGYISEKESATMQLCECAYQELHQSAKKFWCWNFFFSFFFLFLQDSVVGWLSLHIKNSQ